jgi:hypothetical protein
MEQEKLIEKKEKELSLEELADELYEELEPKDIRNWLQVPGRIGRALKNSL